MSEPSKPETPSQAQFQPGRNVTNNIDFLTNIGQGLVNGDIPEWLRPYVMPNSDLVRAQTGLAIGDTTDVYNKSFQNTVNTLEANNQLISSSAANSLTQLNEAFSNDIANINTKFYIDDLNRASANSLSLFGTGLSTVDAATSQGQTLGNRQNAYNQQLYENQYAANYANAQPNGFGGSLGGALGMGLGALLAPTTGGLSLLAGAGLGGAIGGGIGEMVSPSASGTGGGFISGGLSLAGSDNSNGYKSLWEKLLGQRTSVTI